MGKISIKTRRRIGQYRQHSTRFQLLPVAARSDQRGVEQIIVDYDPSGTWEGPARPDSESAPPADRGPRHAAAKREAGLSKAPPTLGGSGYGFLFYQYGSEPFWDAIKRARKVFENQAEWERLRKRAASLDFSWALAAESYEALYGELLAQTSVAA